MFKNKKIILAAVLAGFIACGTAEVKAVNWQNIKVTISRHKGKIIATALVGLTLTHPKVVGKFILDETLLALKSGVRSLYKHIVFTAPLIIVGSKMAFSEPIRRAIRQQFEEYLLTQGFVRVTQNEVDDEQLPPDEHRPHIRMMSETHMLPTDYVLDASHNICPICREEMDSTNTANPLVQINACQHIFHLQCLAPYAAGHDTYPLCMQHTNRLVVAVPTAEPTAAPAATAEFQEFDPAI